jgi:hypothetical protein
MSDVDRPFPAFPRSKSEFLLHLERSDIPIHRELPAFPLKLAWLMPCAIFKLECTANAPQDSS